MRPLEQLSRRLQQSVQPVQGGGGTPTLPQGLQYVNPAINGIDWTFYPVSLPAGVILGNTTFSSPVANALQTNALIQITAGYDFYWCTTTQQTNNADDNWNEGAAGAGQLIPLVTVLITDSASQRNLMQNPVPIGALAGDGKQPMRQVMPRLFKASASVAFTFAYYGPTGSSAPNNYYEYLYLVLGGFQVPSGQPLSFVSGAPQR